MQVCEDFTFFFSQCTTNYIISTSLRRDLDRTRNSWRKSFLTDHTNEKFFLFESLLRNRHRTNGWFVSFVSNFQKFFVFWCIACLPKKLNITQYDTLFSTSKQDTIDLKLKLVSISIYNVSLGFWSESVWREVCEEKKKVENWNQILAHEVIQRHLCIK